MADDKFLWKGWLIKWGLAKVYLHACFRQYKFCSKKVHSRYLHWNSSMIILDNSDISERTSESKSIEIANSIFDFFKWVLGRIPLIITVSFVYIVKNAIEGLIVDIIHYFEISENVLLYL